MVASRKQVLLGDSELGELIVLQYKLLAFFLDDAGTEQCLHLTLHTSHVRHP
jgi:hypothetical protein